MSVPRVGIAVIIIRDGKMLIGKRKSSLGLGSWAPPGGHLEFGETPEACAARETMEEAGLVLRDIRHAAFTSDVIDGTKHYVTLFLTAHATGEPRVCEPDKCERWEWHTWDDLPQPLFPSLQTLKETGFRPT